MSLFGISEKQIKTGFGLEQAAVFFEHHISQSLSNNMVFVYDEKNRLITNKEGELQGFSSTSYVVKRGHQINVYDEKGHILWSTTV